VGRRHRPGRHLPGRRRLHLGVERGSYVSSREVAEEVAQETWVAVLEGIDRFEGRSSLKTWIFRILTNQAKTRGARERRSTPFSALGPEHDNEEEPAMPPDSFFAEDHRWAGHWSAPVHPWTLPEERLLSSELGSVIQRAVDTLPPAQRAVVVLRDSQALSAAEVCDLLSLTEGNQRVLLHRGRAKVRAAIATYVGQLEVAT
jgi:RNA polymerase sigma-70 factor (ECF subfamily)